MQIDRSLKFIFWLLLFEVMIGGAGRVFDFGGITLRMLFFVIGLLISLYYIIKGKSISPDVYIYVLVFLGLLFIGVLMGVLNGANPSMIQENFLMNSYFFIFPLFSLMIVSTDDVRKVIKLFIYSSLFLSTAFFIIFLIIVFKLVDFITLYNFFTNSEFGFRSENAIFYKGFIFMCCGLFFLQVSNTTKNIILQVFVLFSIIATFVRGFLVSLFGTYLIYLLFFRNFIIGLIIFFGSIFLLPIALNLYLTFLGNRTEFDAVRYLQLEQVGDRLNFMNIFIGSGFGVGVPIRENHFEINYLEIFYKQGIIGILFWLIIIIDVIVRFKNACLNGNSKAALPFLLSPLFLYIQSLSNPFLSNSMGITIVLISLTCLSVLSKEKIELQ